LGTFKRRIYTDYLLHGGNYPDFDWFLQSLAPTIEADIILVCKARMPSLQLGLLMKKFGTARGKGVRFMHLGEEKRKDRLLKTNARDPQSLDKEMRQLSKWLEKLGASINLFFNSKTWRLVNGLGKIAAIVPGRESISPEEKRLRRIFREYNQWKPGRGKKIHNLKKLSKWLEKVDHSYRKLSKSRRFRAANRIIAVISLLKVKQKKSVEQNKQFRIIESILEDYNIWKNKKNIREQYDLLDPLDTITVTEIETAFEPYELNPPLK